MKESSNYEETIMDELKGADRPLHLEDKKASILEHHLAILNSNLYIMGLKIDSIIESSEKLCDFKNETAQFGHPENDSPESIVQTLVKYINRIELYNTKLSLVESHLKEVI